MENLLKLPRNYLKIEEEEMMYLDGGGYWTHRGHADWTYTLTVSDCNLLAFKYSTLASISGALSSIAAIAPFATAISLLSGVYAAVFSYAATKKGFRIYFHTMWWGKEARWAQVI